MTELLEFTVDTMNGSSKKVDFTKYDVVFYVAGIAYVGSKLDPNDFYGESKL